MKTKKVFFTEMAYVIGIIVLAVGTAFMERANFGMSMVVAPAYILHLKISQYLPFYSFGMSEYVFQAVLLILICMVMKTFKKGYLFSFATAVIYGFTLDLAISAVSFITVSGAVWDYLFYILGLLLGSVGVAFLFRTYISPEAYELFVKEVTDKWKFNIGTVKTVYDCCSCLLGVVLSFCFFGFGHFEGVKLGTILCALVNGWLIGKISSGLESCFDFKDGLKLRKLFTT